MQVIYLAGPINDTTDAEMFDWRRDMIHRLPGHYILDPTIRDYRGQEDVNVDLIVEQDKADIDTADIIIAYCPKPSVGTSMEILYAFERGKPAILYIPPGAPISPWLRYHAHVICSHPAAVVSAVLATIAHRLLPEVAIFTETIYRKEN